MKIGSVHLQSPFILAPLAGYTDLAFRLLCREMGAGMTVSEMISSNGLVHGQEKTKTLLKTVPEETPFCIQLFGNDPEIMGEAAAIASTYSAEILDINMGCPVRKVVKKGSGAALMKNFQLARQIIQAVVANTHLPVTVKFRSGWTENDITAPEFAAMAEDAGVSALTVHARTWQQMFGGKADRQVIRKVKKSVNIPVIGNGDILCYHDGQDMMNETGCDSVMVGRGALGNPWIFQPGEIPSTVRDRLPVIKRHLALANTHIDTIRLLFRIKNQICRYLTGLPGAVNIRKQITACPSIEAINDIMIQFDG